MREMKRKLIKLVLQKFFSHVDGEDYNNIWILKSIYYSIAGIVCIAIDSRYKPLPNQSEYPCWDNEILIWQTKAQSSYGDYWAYYIWEEFIINKWWTKFAFYENSNM